MRYVDVDVEAERLCVFYLVIDHQPDGFRWLVRQFGVETACIGSKRPFATEIEARRDGQGALISVSATFDRSKPRETGSPMRDERPVASRLLWDLETALKR